MTKKSSNPGNQRGPAAGPAVPASAAAPATASISTSSSKPSASSAAPAKAVKPVSARARLSSSRFKLSSVIAVLVVLLAAAAMSPTPVGVSLRSLAVTLRAKLTGAAAVAAARVTGAANGNGNNASNNNNNVNRPTPQQQHHHHHHHDVHARHSHIPMLHEATVGSDVIKAVTAAAGPLPLSTHTPYKWGTYRPSVYVGLRARHPASPLFGLMWFDPYQAAPLDLLRHEARSEEHPARLEWAIHDGRHYGMQTVLDGAYNVTTEFIQDPAREDSFALSLRVQAHEPPAGSEAARVYHSHHTAEPRQALKRTPVHQGKEPAISLLWYWVLPDDADDVLMPAFPPAVTTALATSNSNSGARKENPGYPLSAPLTTRLILNSTKRAFDFTSKRVKGAPAPTLDTAALPAAVEAYLAQVNASFDPNNSKNKKGSKDGKDANSGYKDSNTGSASVSSGKAVRERNPLYQPPPQQHHAHYFHHRPLPPPERRWRYQHPAFTAPHRPADEVRFTAYRTSKDPWRVHDVAVSVLTQNAMTAQHPAYGEQQKLLNGVAKAEDAWDSSSNSDSSIAAAKAIGDGKSPLTPQQLQERARAEAANKHGNLQVPRGLTHELGISMPQLDNTLRATAPPPNNHHFMFHGGQPPPVEAHKYASSVNGPVSGTGMSRVVVFQATLKLPVEMEYTLFPATGELVPKSAVASTANKDGKNAAVANGKSAVEAVTVEGDAKSAAAYAPAVTAARRDGAAAFAVPASTAHGEYMSKKVPELRADARKRFHDRFEKEFGLSSKNFTADQVAFGKMAMSSLLGGMGYWHGRGRLMQRVGYGDATTALDSDFKQFYADSAAKKFISPHRLTTLENGRNNEIKAVQVRNYRTLQNPEQELFSCSPSRVCFPRGFLWDEGFHQLLVSRWDPALSQQVFATWAAMIDSEGWLPREQILGDEARTRVPEEFQTQRSDIANPPTQVLALKTMLAHMLEREGARLGCELKLAGSLHHAVDKCGGADNIKWSSEFTQFVAFLRDVLPSYRRQAMWYLQSQAAPAHADPQATGVSYEELVKATTATQPGQVSEAAVEALLADAKAKAAARAEDAAASRIVPDDLPWTLTRDLSWLNASVYMWHSRTRAHALSSGLDDYPRLPIGPSPFVLSEGHVDLQAWLIMSANTLADLSETLLDLATIIGDENINNIITSNNTNKNKNANYRDDTNKNNADSTEEVPAPERITVNNRAFPVTGPARSLRFPPGTTPAARDFYTALAMHEHAAESELTQQTLNQLPPLLPVPPPRRPFNRAALEKDIIFFRSKAESLLQTMNRLMYDPVAKKYADFAVIAGNYDAEAQNVYDRFVRKFGVKDGAKDVKPGHVFIHHDGYVSLMPLFLGLVPVESNSTKTPSKLLSMLDVLSSPQVMTNFGIRSLSRADPLFGAGENYWRGNVWVPVNVLALQGLTGYVEATSGEMREKIVKLREKLKDGIISNLYQEYKKKGYLFENYEANSGHGARCAPFTGWSALVVLLMDGSV